MCAVRAHFSQGRAAHAWRTSFVSAMTIHRGWNAPTRFGSTSRPSSRPLQHKSAPNRAPSHHVWRSSVKTRPALTTAPSARILDGTLVTFSNFEQGVFTAWFQLERGLVLRYVPICPSPALLICIFQAKTSHKFCCLFNTIVLFVTLGAGVKSWSLRPIENARPNQFMRRQFRPSAR